MFGSRSLLASASLGPIVAVALVALPQTASAQTASSSQPGVGEIIVTAQKRAQKIGDVGATIDVSSGKDLKTLGVTNVGQLTSAVPGFTAAISQTGAPLFALRGINFNAAQFSAPPAVSVYVDEVPLPYSFMTDGAFLDVDHIEVVKGPQGTLFGENSTGGSINVIPVKPSSTFSLGTEFSINNFGQVQNESHIGGGLSSTLNARLAVSTTQFGAWQRPYYLGKDKNGDQNKGAARLLLDWTPTDRLFVSLNLNANYNNSEAQQPQDRLFTPQFAPAANPLLATYPLPHGPRDADIDPGFNTHQRNRFYQAAARIEYELTDDLKLISISNYTSAKIHVPINLDGTALPGVNTISDVKDKVFSQEVRLSGHTPDDRINYIAGGNYENNDMYEHLYQDFFSYSGLPTGAQLYSPFKVGARYIAAFANADVKILPMLTLTGGLRYTKARETQSSCTKDGGNGITAAVIEGASDALRGAEGLPPTNAFVPGGCITLDDTGAVPTYAPVNLDQRQNEHNLSWRAGINFKPDPNTLLYALVSRGYKAGVWLVNDLILKSAAVPVKQEKLTAYEGGAKLSLFDRKLTLNGAFFYYDYVNKQFSTIAPSFLGGVFILKNIPKSKAYGVDADFSARLAQGLTIHGGLTWLHTRIGSFIGYDHVTLLPIQYEGSQFSYAPKLSATFGAEYRARLSDEITGLVGMNGVYVAKTWGDLGEADATLLPSYATVDFRIGLESTNKWHTSLWVRNATDKYYALSTAPSGDTQTQMVGMPRTFGATVGFDF
jgi:outer membrane receptor protein involved in Fe transport